MKLVLNLKIGIHGKGHTLWLDEFTTQETGCKTSESKGELDIPSIIHMLDLGSYKMKRPLFCFKHCIDRTNHYSIYNFFHIQLKLNCK